VSNLLAGAAKPVIREFGRAETGATAIEYALIACLVSVFIVGALTMTSNSVIITYNYISNAMVSVVGN
jgi:pilus assembly protein Flp/PilA